MHLIPTLIRNRYFNWPQKLSLARNLYPMLFGSEAYYARMDNYSYQDWHLSHGISELLLKKMFLPLSLALKFVTPQHISARVVLDVSGIFLRQNNASRMGFLPGSPAKHFIDPLPASIPTRALTITPSAN